MFLVCRNYKSKSKQDVVFRYDVTAKLDRLWSYQTSYYVVLQKFTGLKTLKIYLS